MQPLKHAEQRDDEVTAQPKTPVRRVYQFGDFELSTSPLRLDRDGVKVDAPPQSLRVLELLLRDVGSVVRTEQLVPGANNNGRARLAVVQLRKALEDRSKSPTYVETVRSHGYRFVHPVEVVEEPLVRWRTARMR